MRVAWFPILFLLLAVPLPQSLYVDLTFPLRKFATAASAAIMPVFVSGLYTEAQAVVIDYILPNGTRGQLNVEEACSGMRLLMAFVTLGVAMAYLGDRPNWQRLVMVAGCVPIAIFCNTIRVTTTGLFFVYGHEDLAKGTPHQLLGLAMLAIALASFGLLGYLLNHLFVEETAADDSGSANVTC
jgi:exosortase